MRVLSPYLSLSWVTTAAFISRCSCGMRPPSCGSILFPGTTPCPVPRSRVGMTLPWVQPWALL